MQIVTDPSIRSSQSSNQAFRPLLKNLKQHNSSAKLHLEDLEHFILGTSETINEKLEEIERQMTDLHVEIRSNIDLVTEKRRMQASDTNQFIRVLCEDVR